MVQPATGKYYRLKSMVLARILAEVTVLSILLTLPLILMATGYLATAAISAKVLIFSLCLVAGLILPAYAFVTWRVKVDENGLTTISLAKQQYCTWASMKRISRRSNWNWVRYVIELNEGEISFPIWLNDCEKLLETIRSKMPGAGSVQGSGSPYRKFSQDPIAILFQLVQAAMGIGLVVVLWFFFVELLATKTTSQSDLGIVLAFSLIVTAIILWRTLVVILMPRKIELTAHGIIVDTIIFNRRITWQQVKAIAPSPPLLPEGFMLKSAKGSFLIGNGTDSADELVTAIQNKLKLTNGTAALSHSPDTGTTGNTIVDDSPLRLLETEQATITGSMPPSAEEDADEEPGDLIDFSPEPDEKEVAKKPPSSGKKPDRRFRKRRKRN